MGFNTAVILINDAFDQIENDKDFGKKLVDATGKLALGYYSQGIEPPSTHGIDISSGNHCNAATVVGSCHADFSVLYAFGGNCVSYLESIYDYRHNSEETQVRLLKTWAAKLGYKIVKVNK